MTLKFCLEQLGHAIIFTPLLLIFRLFKISQPILISSTGSDAKEILIDSRWNKKMVKFYFYKNK